MYRPLFWLSLGAATTLVLAFATLNELTRFRPEVELHRAVAAFAQAKTVEVKTAASWVDGQGAARTVSTLYLLGQARPSGPNIGDYAGKFRLVRLSGADQKYDDLSGEERALGNMTYLTYEPPGPDVADSPFAAAGTWLALAPADLPRWSSPFPGVAFPFASIFDVPAPWAVDALAKLAAAAPALDIAYISGDGRVETVSGHPCHVIDLRLDRAATESALLDLVRLKENRDPSDAERLRVSTVADGLSRLAIRVWTGTADHLPYQLEAGGSVLSGQSSIPFNVLADLSGYDAPFASAAPARTVTLAAALPAIAAARPSASEGAAAAPAVHLPSFPILGTDDADSDGLNAILETFYGTDPHNADTDRDGVSDGAEIRQGCNPLGRGTLFGFGIGKALNQCP